MKTLLMLLSLFLPFTASQSNIFEEFLKGVNLKFRQTNLELCTMHYRMPVLPDKEQIEFESKITAFDVCIKDFNQMTDQLLSDFRPIAEQEFDKLDAKIKQFLASYDRRKLQKRGFGNIFKIFRRPRQSDDISNYLNDDVPLRDPHLSEPASNFLNRYPESEYGLPEAAYSDNLGSSLSSLENIPRPLGLPKPAGLPPKPPGKPPSRPGRPTLFSSKKNREKKWYQSDIHAKSNDGTVNSYPDEQSLNGFQSPQTPHSNGPGPNSNLHVYDDANAIPDDLNIGRFDDDAISDIQSEHSFGALDEIDYLLGPNSNGHAGQVNSIPQYNGINPQQSFDEVFDAPQ